MANDLSDLDPIVILEDDEFEAIASEFYRATGCTVKKSQIRELAIIILSTLRARRERSESNRFLSGPLCVSHVPLDEANSPLMSVGETYSEFAKRTLDTIRNRIDSAHEHDQPHRISEVPPLENGRGPPLHSEGCAGSDPSEPRG